MARPNRFISIFKIPNTLKFRFVLFFFILAVTEAIITYFGIKFSILQVIQKGIITDDTLISKIEIMGQFIMALHFFFLIGFLFLFFLVVHTITGPIYRFEKTMDIIRQGDIRHNVYIRKGDDLQSVADKINLAFSNLRDFIEEERSEVRQLVATLNKLLSLLREEDNRKIYAEIRSQLDAFESREPKIKI